MKTSEWEVVSCLFHLPVHLKTTWPPPRRVPSTSIYQLSSHSHTFPARLDPWQAFSLASPRPRWFQNLGGLAEPTPLSQNWNTNSESHVSSLSRLVKHSLLHPEFLVQKIWDGGQEPALLTSLQMMPLVLTPSLRSTGLELFITQKWLISKTCYLTSFIFPLRSHSPYSCYLATCFWLIIPFTLHICYFQRWPLSSKPQPTLCFSYYQQITSPLIYFRERRR